MPIEMVCPNPACAQRYTISSSVVGRSTRCRACRQTFVIGASSTADGTNPSAHVPPAPSGSRADLTTVGRFVVRGKLGAGAFGTVYRAYDPNLNREVALKIPNPGAMDTPQRVERFLREAKAAAVLRHPHIVPVFDAGQDGDRYYIASAFIDGKPLAETIEEGGTDFPRAARIVRELAEALAYAHEQGIVHRDVKPQNIMEDAHGHIHLMDFGLAARHDEESKLTADGAVMGTPAYMSPEMAKGQTGEVQPPTDQYAVGVVLYELLTGKTPFAGPAMAVLHQVMYTEPDPPRRLRPTVPVDLQTICLKAMAKCPEGRYPNCEALADDLRRWIEGEPITARRMGLGDRAAQWVKKEPKLSAAAAVIALVLLSSVGLVSNAARRAENALDESREARKREEQEAGEKLGALGTALQERKKAEEYQAQARSFEEQAAHERKKADALQPQVEEALKKARTLQARIEEGQKRCDEERGRAETLQARIEEAQEKAQTLQVALTHTERFVQAAYQAYEDGTIEDARVLLQGVSVERRGWEWYHVQKLCTPPTDNPLVFAVKKHSKGSVSPSSFSPDGKKVATVNSDGTARVWDAESGVATPLRGHVGYVNSVAFSTDGKRIVTSGDDKMARVWDVDNVVQLHLLKRHTERVNSAAFSKDGSKVATGSSDGRVLVWDAKTGGFLREVDGLSERVNSVAFSRDGTRIVTSSEGKIARVWDANNGREICVLRGHTAGVTSAVFSPDGKKVVTASSDHTARVWGAESGLPLFELKGQSGYLLSAAFSPDGQRLVTSGENKTARVWDANSGVEIFVLRGHTARVASAVFSPDGKRVVTGSDDKTVRVWDAISGTPLLSIRYMSQVDLVAWNSDGSKLLVGFKDGGIEIRDGPTPPAPASKP